MPTNPMQKASRAMMRLMAHMMPSCREISQMVSEAMDQRLPLRKRLAIRFHISMCALCRRYEKQLQLVREGTRRYADPDGNPGEKSLSPAARERLKHALEEKG
jgi:hypothetical protein